MAQRYDFNATHHHQKHGSCCESNVADVNRMLPIKFIFYVYLQSLAVKLACASMLDDVARIMHSSSLSLSLSLMPSPLSVDLIAHVNLSLTCEPEKAAILFTGSGHGLLESARRVLLCVDTAVDTSLTL